MGDPGGGQQWAPQANGEEHYEEEQSYNEWPPPGGPLLGGPPPGGPPPPVVARTTPPLPPDPHPEDCFHNKGVLEVQSLKDPEVFSERHFELAENNGMLIFWHASDPDKKHANFVRTSKIYEVRAGFDKPTRR